MTEEQKIKELLKPRYKVIALWPSMRDFSLNQIIKLDKQFSPEYMMYEVEDCQGKRTYITKFFEEYPHLFQKIQWWEDRKPEDMPQYVKYGDVTVRKVSRFDLESSSAWFMFLEGDNIPYSPGASSLVDNHWLPATEQEYLDYQNKSK